MIKIVFTISKEKTKGHSTNKMSVYLKKKNYAPNQ